MLGDSPISPTAREADGILCNRMGVLRIQPRGVKSSEKMSMLLDVIAQARRYFIMTPGGVREVSEPEMEAA